MITAENLRAVYNSYGHMTGIGMGEMAHRGAPCILALARKTEGNPEPLIDVAEMKAFFKALNDAPDDQIAYANRFMSKYS